MTVRRRGPTAIMTRPRVRANLRADRISSEGRLIFGVVSDAADQVLAASAACSGITSSGFVRSLLVASAAAAAAQLLLVAEALALDFSAAASASLDSLLSA